MEFDNSFDVPLPPPQAWAVLMDIPRIAPCMPGAELTEIADGNTYRGKISVRLGPVALTFAGRVEFESIDDAGHSARIKAHGNDAKGRGAASAMAAFHLEPAGNGSKVLIHTDLTLSGAVAQYGRGVGMIQATAAQIITQFANNLRTQLAQEPLPPPVQPEMAPPVQPDMTPPDAPPLAASRPAAAPPPPTPPRVAPPPAKPISGLSLLARVLWQQIVALFGGRRS